MKVSNININFGKSLVAKYDIKDVNKKAHRVSLYEYNPENYYDAEDISSSFLKGETSKNFLKSFLTKNNYSKFFILKDDKNDKIVAVSRITQHIAPNNPVMGNYIEINNIKGDRDYPNALTPMIAHISKLAKSDDMDNISAYSNNMTSAELENYGFNKVKYDICVMPKAKFSENVEKVEEEHSINCCV